MKDTNSEVQNKISEASTDNINPVLAVRQHKPGLKKVTFNFKAAAKELTHWRIRRMSINRQCHRLETSAVYFFQCMDNQFLLCCSRQSAGEEICYWCLPASLYANQHEHQHFLRFIVCLLVRLVICQIYHVGCTWFDDVYTWHLAERNTVCIGLVKCPSTDRSCSAWQSLCLAGHWCSITTCTKHDTTMWACGTICLTVTYYMSASIGLLQEKAMPQYMISIISKGSNVNHNLLHWRKLFILPELSYCGFVQHVVAISATAEILLFVQ